MPFSDDEISRLETLLHETASIPQAVAQIRCLFPGKSVTRCHVSDMGDESPYRRFGGFDLHWVDGRDHCWQITGNPAAATGIVLAQHAAKNPARYQAVA